MKIILEVDVLVRITGATKENGSTMACDVTSKQQRGTTVLQITIPQPESNNITLLTTQRAKEKLVDETVDASNKSKNQNQLDAEKLVVLSALSDDNTPRNQVISTVSEDNKVTLPDQEVIPTKGHDDIPEGMAVCTVVHVPNEGILAELEHPYQPNKETSVGSTDDRKVLDETISDREETIPRKEFISEETLLEFGSKLDVTEGAGPVDSGLSKELPASQDEIFNDNNTDTAPVQNEEDGAHQHDTDEEGSDIFYLALDTLESNAIDEKDVESSCRDGQLQQRDGEHVIEYPDINIAEWEYKDEDPIAEGRFGQIDLARAKDSSQGAEEGWSFVLKVMKLTRAADLTVFWNEVETFTKLGHHSFIVQFFGPHLDESANFGYLLMDRARYDLPDRISYYPGRILPEEHARFYVAETALDSLSGDFVSVSSSLT
ncbi:hypothetical protein HDU76_010588 [Blyttiomyces sp. JEL0837]|nr:hypothetical protein HDU76_010588 [Blyttiomyces sp. JEL0837]